MRPLPVANPPNPWASTSVEYLEGVDPDGDPFQPTQPLVVLEDRTRSILAHNDSPDLGFRWSANPYRGCMHACSYCYARPGHQYLSLGAGTDFDRTIVVKPEAAALLREAFEKKSWVGERVLFSGVTDCYQPLEASYRLTRACLEVCTEYRNPVGIVTKAALVERDLDVLVALHAVADLHVTISVPVWAPARARALEPGAPAPSRRIRTIERLAAAGLDVGVNVAPIIGGLTDEEAPTILEAARAAGARRAGFVLLRLPGAVRDVFVPRLEAAFPERAARVLARVREARGGELDDSRFGVRMTGEGAYAEATMGLLETTAKKLGYQVSRAPGEPDATTFRRPPRRGAQLGLFDD